MGHDTSSRTEAGLLYAAIADLPLLVEDFHLELLEEQVSSGFIRVTTLVRIHGGGHTGAGEDVTYDAEVQRAMLIERSAWDLTGSYTFDSFSERLESDIPAALLPHARWGFESAALDLSLKQAGLTLAQAFGLDLNPVRFVVSTRLGSPPSAAAVDGWLEHYPRLEFKLDPQSSWTPGLVERLASTGSVRILDFKGIYHGTPVDQPFDLDMYLLVARGFPSALLEDPAPEALLVPEFAPFLKRLSWDAPIHSVEDVTALPQVPAAVNIKPSRFGSFRRLLDTIEHCTRSRIPLYGGGQFELGPGREQIQCLASLFYPNNPNDVAPRDYNVGEPRPGLPESPLRPVETAPGFSFAFA